MRSCNYTNCSNKYYAKGWCSKHYLVFWKWGSFDNYSPDERHGMRNIPEYRVWVQMKQRCNNPKNKNYKYYGGRGIGVCKRWQLSFKDFINDMGRRPQCAMVIDRINTDGNYEPSNCRWTTYTINNRNHRNKKLNEEQVREIKKLTSKLSYKEIGEIYNVSAQTIHHINKGIIWKDVA